jgi:hypothetical protein
MASGNPSTRRQIRVTADTFVASREKPELTAAARSANNLTAS